jgi:Transglycosylase SLT domain
VQELDSGSAMNLFRPLYRYLVKKRRHWASFLIGIWLLMAQNIAFAGACICDCYYCAYWSPCLCEIWSPEALEGIAEETEAVLAALSASVAALSKLIVEVDNSFASVGGKVVEALGKSSASNKVLNEGQVAVTKGNNFLFGKKTGFVGSAPKSADEAAAHAIMKNIAADPSSKVCNEILTGSQSLALVSSGKDIAKDAMNTRMIDSMGTSRAADAESSFNRHVAAHCTLSDVFNGLCVAAAADHMQDLDVLPPGYGDRGEGMNKQLSEEEKRAAQGWLDNVIGLGNYPASDYAEDVYNSDARKSFSGINHVIQARTSVVTDALNAEIARRSKVVIVFNSDLSARADVQAQMTDANPSLAPASMAAGSPDTTTQCAASTDYARYQNIGSSTVNAAINSAYDSVSSSLGGYGVSLSAFHYYAYIESTKNPQARAGTFYGLYQLGSGALSDINMSGLLPDGVYDPVQNAKAGALYAQKNIGLLKNMFPNGVQGVTPAFAAYAMHNMGPTGFKEIYNNVTSGTPLSDIRKLAIQKNMSPKVPLNEVTGRMYWEFWKKKFGLSGC